MVRKTIIALIDDLDGGTAAETVVFSVDGVCYEIDLSEENAERLRDALTEFVVAARRVNRPTPAVGNAVGSGTSRHPRPAARPARLRPRDTQQIRDWAARRGISVQLRGRLPEDVVNAYYTEQSARAPAPASAMDANSRRNRHD